MLFWWLGLFFSVLVVTRSVRVDVIGQLVLRSSESVLEILAEKLPSWWKWKASGPNFGHLAVLLAMID